MAARAGERHQPAGAATAAGPDGRAATSDGGDSAGSWRGWRAWRVSPRAFRLITAAAVWALVLTIISGAAVRLTGSGLGCPDWPNCTATDVVAPLQFHAWVEFGNRLINALVTVAALGTLVAASGGPPGAAT